MTPKRVTWTISTGSLKSPAHETSRYTPASSACHRLEAPSGPQHSEGLNSIPWIPQWLALTKSVSYFYRDLSHTKELGKRLRGHGGEFHQLALEYATLCAPGTLQHNRAAHTARRSKAVSHFCSSSFFLWLCARRHDILVLSAALVKG